MAPSPITEDYYMILEVEPTASHEQIVSSYRKLALKLHPDRNARRDATATFQRLGQAYETLSDESKRRAYDRIYYPSITRKHPSAQSTKSPRPRTTATRLSELLDDEAQIAMIQKLKELEQELNARGITQTSQLNSLFEGQKDISRSMQEIKNLASVLAAELAEEGPEE